jgi:hypothetical protein
MTMSIGSVTVSQWDLGDPENPVTGTESASGSGAAYYIFLVLQAQTSQALRPWPIWHIPTGGNVVVTNTALDGEVFSYTFADSPEEGGKTAGQKLYEHLTSIAAGRYGQLKSMADLAVAIASLCGYIAANAALSGATANIAADASGDGLQNGTSHPATPKTIPVSGGIA